MGGEEERWSEDRDRSPGDPHLDPYLDPSLDPHGADGVADADADVDLDADADADLDVLFDTDEPVGGAPLPPPGRLLPPEDRLWRHPSELAGLSLAGAGAGIGAGAFGRSTRPARSGAARAGQRAGAWPLALLGAVVGATVITGVLAATVGVGRGPSITFVSGSATVPVTAVASRSLPAVRSVADDVRPSLARVELSTGNRSWAVAGLGLGEGRLLTSEAALEGATRIRVVHADGTREPATVLGTDPATGVAVLSLALGTVPSPRWGSALDLRAGSPVVVLGAADAQGRDQEAVVATVAATGATHRIDDGPALTDLLRVDDGPAAAAGAAVMDRRGGVIGFALPTATFPPTDDGTAGGTTGTMAVAAATATGSDAEPTTAAAVPAAEAGSASQGTELSVVPVEVALAVADDLAAGRPPATGALGVTLDDLSAAGAEELGVDGGVVVRSAGDAAMAAGLAPGDVVVAVDGRPVRDAAWLSLALRRWEPGRQVVLTTVREGERGVLWFRLVPA